MEGGTRPVFRPGIAMQPQPTQMNIRRMSASTTRSAMPTARLQVMSFFSTGRRGSCRILPISPRILGSCSGMVSPCYSAGMVDQELLARIEYLAAENRILKDRLKGRLKLSDAERATLGEVGHLLGRKVLGEVANVARPDTILAWYRKLVACKFDGSKARRSPGRPPGLRFPRTSRGMQQIARNGTMEGWGALRDCRYLLH